MANLNKIKSQHVLVERTSEVKYYMFFKQYDYLGKEFLVCKEISTSEFMKLNFKKARLFTFINVPQSFYIVLPSVYQLFLKINSYMLYYGQLIEVDYE